MAYFNQNKIGKIIVTGKAVYNRFEEAEVQKKYLISHHVPENVILKENESANTADNALYTSRLVQQLHLKNIVIVTSHYHKKRAQYIFSHYFHSFKIVTPFPGIFYRLKNLPFYLWDMYCLKRTKKGDDRLQRK